MWIMHALLTGFGIGVGNYLIAGISGQGVIALAYVGIIASFMLIIYRVREALQNKKKYGTYINYSKSNFYTPEKTFKRQNVVPLLGNGVTNLINLVSITYAFKYALLGGIN